MARIYKTNMTDLMDLPVIIKNFATKDDFRNLEQKAKDKNFFTRSGMDESNGVWFETKIGDKTTRYTYAFGRHNYDDIAIWDDDCKKAFKREHENYITKFHIASNFNGENVKKICTKEQIIVHELLSNECFYLFDKRNINNAMRYILEAYPETTINEIQSIYEEYKDMVTEIYG